MKLFDIALSALIPGLVLVHLAVAPYTKVEESFNIQAAHDVLVYGTPTSDINEKLSSTYDHITFPGAVPRTFIGPVLLAGVAQPIVAVVGFDKAQLVIRAILGLFNAACLLAFARNMRRAYGAATARWYLLLQASQFHAMFYASRTLPNMFAFGLTTLAFAFILPQPNRKQILPRQRLAITMLVFSAVVFRSEIALLLGTTMLYLLLVPETSLQLITKPFIVSFVVALLISVPVDSYFWQKPVWPELWGFYYNAVLGSSSEWGVSPWHYYFTSALPRLMVSPFTWTVLIPLSLRHPALAPAGRRLTIPSLLFIAIYSLQPHKEARFIFYAIPPLTGAAALGANLVFNRLHHGESNKKGSIANTFLALILVASIALSFAASSAMLLVSSLNYPGGEALAHLRDIAVLEQGHQQHDLSSPPNATGGTVVPVHADVLACMTGVTLFGTATGPAIPGGSSSTSATSGGTLDAGGSIVGRQPLSAVAGGVTLAVDKTEDSAVLARDDFWRKFDYVLVEDRSKVKGGEWEEIGVVQGYAGIEIIRGGGHKYQDIQKKKKDATPIVGNGALIGGWKNRVMTLTGGKWIGPRMVPRIYILRRVKDAKRLRKTVDA
ncbi:Alg9-like mannosyltransferase family-domain-containing protein [Podospora didyma]|uniref:Mannosyltransferase n=1 Tax=Podospora didyma TaxID=330526 RepID=A0AAE0U7U5_9PEZI|nr:Alg9-like mannosyltransferase family-domain-containing protein [Podospora didyma]